jgi:hypothetical protein
MRGVTSNKKANGIHLTNQLHPWGRVIIEKAIDGHVVKKFSRLIEPKVTKPCSQDPILSQLSPHPHKLFLQEPL